MKKLTKKQFIDKVIQKYGDVFTFENVIYVDNRTPVCVTCNKHGNFLSRPGNLLCGKGCPGCKKDKISSALRMGFKEFTDKCKVLHSDKYTYDPESFLSARTSEKIKITCPQHGVFLQSRAVHLRGNGCPECARHVVRRLTEKQVSNAVLNRGFSILHYDKSSLSNKSIFKCSSGHTWDASYNNVVNNKSGCPKCAKWGPSTDENEIYEIVKSICPDSVQSDRTVIGPKELDIYVPSKKVAIEFNGVVWHSDEKKPSGYHREKRLCCEKVGVRLISISEEDWKQKREHVLQIVRSALGVREGLTVNARDCVISEITAVVYRDFMESNHIQGYAHAPFRYALTHPLYGVVAVMSFRQVKHGANKGCWDMVRYATTGNVRGGQSKLFKHVCEVLAMDECQSFVDCDYFTGSSYANSGFSLHADITVSYRIWHRKSGWISRQAWWKSNIPATLTKLGLHADIFGESKTQKEMIYEAGAKIIENSGTKRYVWKKPA